MQQSLFRLLADAGIDVDLGPRGYRPTLSLPNYEVKVLKPQNIVEMLHAGTRDLGFTGADWVAELDGECEELLDTELEPTRLVAAAPPTVCRDGRLPTRRLVIASEFERLTRCWIERKQLHASFVRSYGATEVFPPEDADCVVDLVSTGSTLRANNLVEFDQLMCSSTRLYANRTALERPEVRESAEQLVLLLRSVLDARRRVMLEVNVASEGLAKVVTELPCMREPTVSQLARGAGYAVRAAVPRPSLPTLIPAIKRAGATDVVIMSPAQIVP